MWLFQFLTWASSDNAWFEWKSLFYLWLYLSQNYHFDTSLTQLVRLSQCDLVVTDWSHGNSLSACALRGKIAYIQSFLRSCNSRSLVYCVALLICLIEKEQIVRAVLCKRIRSNGMVIYAIKKIQLKIELMEEGDTSKLSQLRQIACPVLGTSWIEYKTCSQRRQSHRWECFWVQWLESMT